MSKIFTIVTLSVLSVMTTPVWAAMQVVTLSVPGMNCAACPITVKKALKNVKGVNSVEVNFDNKKARVSFDDAKTNVNVLTHATGDAGYPSNVIQ